MNKELVNHPDWKTIDEFPNYEISTNGEIRNKKTKNIRKPVVGKRGYPYTSMTKDGKTYSRTIHIMVARTFIDNPENLPQVNHIDGNKNNYSINNLEWISAKNNNIHARENGLHKSDGDKTVLQMLNGVVIKEYKSASQASRELGISRSAICNVCNKRKTKLGYTRKTAGGYEWKWKM